MPIKSPKQRRLMQAAEHKPGGYGGVSQAVARKFIHGDEGIEAAGVLICTPDRRALFLKRGTDGDHPGEWCLPGGVIEDGESPARAASREVREEIGMAVGAETLDLAHESINDGVHFTTFRRSVPSEFEPILNDEHDEWEWAPIDAPPKPLHPGLRVMLSGMAMDARAPGLAFDRSTVRTYSQDGRLHVAVSNISKAAVNPYVGKEIPDWDKLGLDPKKIYKLYRDPEELAKAADTFNNLPLLSRHVPVTADDHKPELVMGSTGTDAEFAAPFLRNSLVLWAREGIDAVESEERRELSSAYRYRADMTPGVIDGDRYDGVMRDIKGNHVALVEEGRAGADVVVGDSNEEIVMAKKTVLSRKGAVLLGGVAAFLAPLLAQDKAIDIPVTVTPLLKGLTAKNFKTRKQAIVDGITTATKGKLAQDANIDGLVELIDALGGTAVAEGRDDVDPMVNGGAMEDDAQDAEDPMVGKIKAMLEAAGVAPEIIAKIDEVVGATEDPADPVDPNNPNDPTDPDANDAGMFQGKPDPGGKMKAANDRKMAKDKAAKDAKEAEEKKNMVDKPAMDAAIKAAVDATEKSLRKQQKELREAAQFVRPWVGELDLIACDSAEEVYRAALDCLEVADADTLPAAALKPVLQAQPVPGARPKNLTPRIAQDAAVAKSFGDRFPGTKNINVL